MKKASWVEDTRESTPLSPFPKSEEQERRRKRDVERLYVRTSSKVAIKDGDDPTTSEPPGGYVPCPRKARGKQPASQKRP